MSPAALMIVEDDADISEALAEALEDHGHTVIVAADGQEALDKLRAAAVLPRLILLDLMMPVMDGWQFRAAQRQDANLAEIPVVLLSAHVDVRRAAGELGAIAWLRKPVDLQALLAIVTRPDDA
mgnify:FL=1